MLHKFTEIIEVFSKVFFHVPTEVKMMIAVEASVDIEFKVSIVPALRNINVSHNLLLFKIFFIQIISKILILDLNLVHSKLSLHL